ncbi:MAG: YdcF family protein [Deltaproteobacteria bacterium]|nr:YdcF family protein [Deltaproteobacteria bacterium]
MAWIIFSAYSIASYGNYSYEKPADGIIVLGAAVFGTQPSPVFQERINHAITLYQNGYAPIIIFTGGKGTGQQISEAESAKQYAEKQGIPSDTILIETNSRTTEQNLYYARQLTTEREIKRVIIVSDPLHMKRAMTIAKDMGFEAYSSPTLTTKYISWRTQFDFLFREVYYYQRYLLRRPFYRFGS